LSGKVEFFSTLIHYGPGGGMGKDSDVHRMAARIFEREVEAAELVPGYDEGSEEKVDTERVKHYARASYEIAVAYHAEIDRLEGK
jgi:hypothetical protein